MEEYLSNNDAPWAWWTPVLEEVADDTYQNSLDTFNLGTNGDNLQQWEHFALSVGQTLFDEEAVAHMEWLDLPGDLYQDPIFDLTLDGFLEQPNYLLPTGYHPLTGYSSDLSTSMAEFLTPSSSNELIQTPSSSWNSPSNSMLDAPEVGWFSSIPPEVLSQEQFGAPSLELGQHWAAPQMSNGADPTLPQGLPVPVEEGPMVYSRTEVNTSREKMREIRKKTRPEMCEFCSLGFQYNGGLKRHLLTRHPKEAAEKQKIFSETFTCSEKGCNRSYKRSDRLYRHGVKKHGWPPGRRRKTQSTRGEPKENTQLRV